MLYRNPIPVKEDLFHSYVVNQITVITPNLTRWNITPGAWTTFLSKANPYLAAYTVCGTPNSGPVDTKIRNAARLVLQPALKDFANVHLLYNPNVTDEEKILLGFVLVITTKGKPKKPATHPVPEVEYGVGRLLIHFRDELSDHRGKPLKVVRLEAGYCASKTRPATAAEFTRSLSATASPLELLGSEEDRGEIIWFRVRWVGTADLKGPWSEIFSAIMP